MVASIGDFPMIFKLGVGGRAVLQVVPDCKSIAEFKYYPPVPAMESNER